MNKHVSRTIAASCLLLALPVSMALAADQMTKRGNFADRMFETMDANHDGAVTRKEFDAFHDQRFKQMDANHDGKISREEHDAMHQRFAGQMREHLKQRFAQADANKDGALSKEEAQQMPMVAAHFDEIDANHDGKVTLEEIEASIKDMRAQHWGSCGGGHGGMHHGMHGGMMPPDGMKK